MKKEPEQLELFDLNGVKEGIKWGKRHYWYYITSPRNMDMVVGISPDGAPIWTAHDTRPGVGFKPYLFNNRSSAERYKRDRKIAGHVRKWQFSYK